MKRRNAIIGLFLVALAGAAITVWRERTREPEKVIVTWQGKPEFTRYREAPPS